MLRLLQRGARLGPLCVVLVVSTVAATASADARTDFLVRALRTSPMFRVRTQAAISLGSVQAEPQVFEALSGALRDEHPAVRAAAASALERHGDPEAIPALRDVTNDSEPTVRAAVERAIQRLEQVARTRPRSRPLPAANDGGGPTPPADSGPARFYVAVGRPGSNVESVPRDSLEALRTFVERQAASVPGVAMAPPQEPATAANRVLRDRDLTGYYLDTSIVAVEELPTGGVRARVSVVVQTYPDRNIRSMLSGAATVTAGSGPTVQRLAVEGALRSALRGLPGVMQAGAASARASAPRRRR
jgi:hypothetical protein